MSESKPMSFRLNSVARDRLEDFCELTGMRPSEVAKAGIAQFIAPTLNCNTRVLHSEPRATNKEIESKDSIGGDAERHKEEILAYTKSFWDACNNKQYYPRVIKALGDHWEALGERTATDLAASYNAYCSSQSDNGLTPPHPNSWICSHGFLNSTEDSNARATHYDVDG